MAHKSDIKHIRIEPADDGGFMTEVCRRMKKEAIAKGKNAGPMVMPDYDDNITKHVHSSGKELGKFIEGLFPGVSSRSKKGKSTSQTEGGSHVETYEGDEAGGDDEEY